jgi:hypothetical protein
VGSLRRPRGYDGRLPPDAGYHLDLVIPRKEEPRKKNTVHVRMTPWKIIRNTVIKLHAIYSRILVNLLVILVRILVNLPVKLTRLGIGGPWANSTTIQWVGLAQRPMATASASSEHPFGLVGPEAQWPPLRGRIHSREAVAGGSVSPLFPLGVGPPQDGPPNLGARL